MIYCNICGGLANMLFQIAATKSIAIDNNLDYSFPNLNSHLDYLNNENNHNNLLKHSLEYLTILKPLNTEKFNNINEHIKYPFNFEIKSISDNVIIDGFFQSEKYFKHNREAILDMFDFSLYTNYVLEKYSYINNKKCSSIHIRRGDYVRYPNHHPTQSLDYYLSGIEMLKDKTDIFLIFSDDIQWCKENLKIDNGIYIENEKDYIELYLMSLCDNNIISNSSFSWWGAWLNKNKNKIVIGPKLWFGSAITESDKDIIPEDWIKL